MSITTSQFVVPDIADRELMLLTVDILDYIFSKVVVTDPLIYDELIFQVFSEYTDKEAVLAYYNMFIRPSIGTQHAMGMLLKILGIDGEVTEWYNTGDAAYEFGVVMASTPPTVDLVKFLTLINYVKSERSWLVAMHLLMGAGLLLWDIGKWSEDCYSSPFGGGDTALKWDVVEISYP
jgi:hypothetical protein